MMIYVFDWVENIVGNGENASYAKKDCTILTTIILLSPHPFKDKIL